MRSRKSASSVTRVSEARIFSSHSRAMGDSPDSRIVVVRSWRKASLFTTLELASRAAAKAFCSFGSVVSQFVQPMALSAF